MGAKDRRAEEEGLDAPGTGYEDLLLFGEEGEALAESSVSWFEGTVGLEYLRKEPVLTPTHTYTHTPPSCHIQVYRQ